MVSIEVLTQRDGSQSARRLPLVVLGLSTSAFLALSYVICIVAYLVAPGLPVKHQALLVLLPGFEFLTWPAFLLGLAESYAWGWYIALAFGSIYNFFASRVP